MLKPLVMGRAQQSTTTAPLPRQSRVAPKREEAKRRTLDLMKTRTVFDETDEEEVNRLINEEIHKFRRQRRKTQVKAPAKRAS